MTTADNIQSIDNRTSHSQSATLGVNPPRSPSVLFDEAFDILKREYLPLLLCVITILLPVQLLMRWVEARWLIPQAAVVNTQGDDVDFVLALIVAAGYTFFGSASRSIPGLISLVVPMFACGPVVLLVASRLSARTPSLVSSVQGAWKRYPAILALTAIMLLCCLVVFVGAALLLIVLYFIVVFVGSIAAAIVGGTIGGEAAGIAMVILAIVISPLPFVITGLFYGKNFALSISALLVEDIKAYDALARSQELARAFSNRAAAGIFALLPLLILVLHFALIHGVEAGTAMLHLSSLNEFLLTSALSGVVMCTLQAYWMVFVVLLYFDCRVRRECLDVRALAAEANR